MAAAWRWARSDWRRRWTSLALLAALVSVARGGAIVVVAGAVAVTLALTELLARRAAAARLAETLRAE